MPATDQTDDHALLRQFATGNSEAAFATLVERHIGLVHSTALRQTGNPHAAEEITQAVFIILARKAGSLTSDGWLRMWLRRPRRSAVEATPRRRDKEQERRGIAATSLSGWLYQTARLTAANYLRTEIRRARREQEAHMNSLVNENESTDEVVWQQIAPLLDTAMGKLNEADRNAIVLRFFENKSMGEIAAALDAPEATVRKRVTRAVERLRKSFTQRGVTLTAAAIAGAVATNSVQAAPAGLAAAVTAPAAKGALISATLATLAKGTMKTMTWLKLKFTVGMGVAALLVVGVATIALAQSQPTVYSFLEKPPIIASATIEKEINFKTFAPGFPAGAQKQSFTFALDGEDYRMDFGGGMIGKFGETTWQTMGAQVTKFNSNWNKSDGNSGGITAASAVAKMTINLLTTSGITTANPKNITWLDGHKKMTFEGDEGKTYAVEFSEQNGLPVSATVSTTHQGSSTSIPDGILAYRYDPHFFEGQFPVEISRYYGNTANEDAKVFTIRIQSLRISNRHLSSTDLDPDKLIKASNPNFMPLFYSNNVSYWTDAKGKVRRVLTVEENEKEIQRIKAGQKK